MTQLQSASPTFDSVFFGPSAPKRIRVPDYQRAFAWEEKEIDLFIGDLLKYQHQPGSYYFGHFIMESDGGHWEIVDGQQRITTFVVFLLVCRQLAPEVEHRAFHFLERFSTVTYDNEALKSIAGNLASYFDLCRGRSEKEELEDEEIVKCCALDPAQFTRSQKRIAMALRQFHVAFEKKAKLSADRVSDYLNVVMQAACSVHQAATKSVAVNVFEMHNTRGLPLTTIEIVKAKLMRFVYDHSADAQAREEKVAEIQKEFGEIYQLEELLAAKSFRGELTLEQLLRLHLRVVDDGSKKAAEDFYSPALNASTDDLVKYLEGRLQFEDREKKRPRVSGKGVEYALALAREFKRSARLFAEFLPEWDGVNSLVGDVLILERELSCQFFLLVCRPMEASAEGEFSRVDSGTLLLWERLLFTHDFHDRYYRLSNRDNFPKLFGEICRQSADDIRKVIQGYVRDGFRGWDVTKDLQKVVSEYVAAKQENILNNAFHWWRRKMTYAIFKYEVKEGAKVRETMKGTISVEHILPQEWQWKWIDVYCEETKRPTEEEKEKYLKEIGRCINGIGNLLILTPGENTSASNNHPAEKSYAKKYGGGTYAKHEQNREKWRKSSEWERLIHDRGKQILDFMNRELIGSPEADVAAACAARD